MDRNDENRERLGRSGGDRPERTSGRNRETGGNDSPDYTPGDRSTDRNKSGLDKLIDKAQEKGIFEKAERFVKDKFGGRGSSGSSRRR